MTWPTDAVGKPDAKLLDIIAYAIAHAGGNPVWHAVRAHASLCLDDDIAHGGHGQQTVPLNYDNVIFAWAEVTRGCLPDVQKATFCLNEMDHGGGGQGVRGRRRRATKGRGRRRR
jgi:hypothetical protein